MPEKTYDPNARFERAKTTAKQETMAGKQQAQEAIQRRFAAMGMQGSGEAIKQQQLTETGAQEQLGKRLGEIQGAQEQEQFQQEQIKEARGYQTAEREAGQRYASGERISSQDFANLMQQKQQSYATGEREASQDWSQKQTGIAQEFSKQQQDKQNEFAKLMDTIAAKRQETQFGKQIDLAERQFLEEIRINNANLAMAESEANKKDIFEKISSGEFDMSDWSKPLGKGKWVVNPIGAGISEGTKSIKKWF